MQINVAAYNACVTSCINSVRSSSLGPVQAAVVAANAIVTSSNACIATLQSSGCSSVLKSASLRAFQACPWDSATWNVLPTLATVSGGFSVCNVDCISGNACTWTVPAGVTMARFQMWGAGAPSGGSACCGGSMFGGTGAYASVMIPVVAGCQYVICAGGTTFNCNNICYNTNITTYAGCASYVTGYSLNNVCAEGGEPSHFCWMKVASNNVMTVCQMSNPWSACAVNAYQVAPCFCAGASNFCSSGSSNDVAQCIPIIASCKTFYGNTTYSSSNTNYCVYGMPGYFACMHHDQNFYGCSRQQPIYGFTSGCTWTYTSGSCGGCMCCAAIDGIPGAGGWSTHSMGGSFQNGSGGRAGLVCVQYC